MIHSIHLQKDTDADKSDELVKVSPGKTEQDPGILNYRKKQNALHHQQNAGSQKIYDILGRVGEMLVRVERLKWGKVFRASTLAKELQTNGEC